MPSSVIGALRVTLGLDTAEFTSGAVKAETRAEQLGKRIGDSLKRPISAAVSLKGALAGLAGAIAIDAVADATKRALDYADAISDLSDRTGASTKTIQEFRYAAQLSGSSIEQADTALEKFSRTQGLAQAGSDAQVKLFRQLGVTSTDFDTALRQTMDGLTKLPTVQQQNAAALQLFGKSAASLVPLLAQGSDGFNELARRANDLGIVLRDDVVRNAGSVNDQLDTMRMILNAQFANLIAQNATSLTALAQSITDVAGSIIKFLATNPRTALAIMGAIAGARGGALGSGLGAAAGFIAGDKLAQNSDDANNDLAFRRKQFRAAIANRRARQAAASSGGLFSIRRAEGDGSARSGTSAEVVRQGNLYMRAIRLAQQGNSPKLSGRVPLEGNSEAAAAARGAAAADKAAARKREHDEKQARENERRYQNELSRAEEERLSAISDLTVNQEDRVQIDRALNDQERKGRLEQIATDEHLSDAQKKKLSEVTEEVYGLRQNLINQRAEQEMARERLALASARNENEQDILTAQANLATTAKGRQELELKILDLQFAQLRATQEAVLASETSTDSEKQIARERLNVLGTLQDLGRQRIKKENQGPLAQYLDGIPKIADEMDQALEGIQTQGLDALIDGIAKARGSFKDLAATVQSVANDIISSLLKIGLQKGIAALFGSLLGGSRGGGVGELADGINWNPFVADSSGLNLSGARASGGPVVGGKNYLVGEMGPEIFTAPHSGQIVANDDLPMGGRNIVNQNITIAGGVDLMTRTEGYRVAGAVKDATMAAIADRNRRRG